MKQELSPVVMIVAAIVVVALVVFLYWRGTMPEGVKTDKPPKPHPPGGIPTRSAPMGPAPGAAAGPQ